MTIREIEVNRQIGDYVVAQVTRDNVFAGQLLFGVRMAGANEYLSLHPDVTASVHAILNYEAADRRRARREVRA